MDSKFFDIFIPSYHRADNCKTAIYYCKKVGWDVNKVHIFIDSEADDTAEYEQLAKRLGCQLHIFDMTEARERYDYVHRASVSRRSAGQARNMMFDYAIENGIDFYMVQDDDTQYYSIRLGNLTGKKAPVESVKKQFFFMRDFMIKHHIGQFGFSQGGDLIGGCGCGKVYRPKVMNTTFYNLKYIYRPERGVQDDDTSAFAGIMNEGLFCGSCRYGLILHQTPSATSRGGLTDLYNECKLLNKALVIPIQFPSCAVAERQKGNGGRLHHKINYRYLMPKILRSINGRSNIAWDTYDEDYPFTNEPKRNKKIQ